MLADLLQDSRRLTRRACTAALLLLCACEPGADGYLVEARAQLADASWSEAVASAERGLAREPAPRQAWGLELVRLEGLARSGRADESRQLLRELARAFPDRVPATQYSATASQLRGAGQGAAAIEVLDMGLARFPGDPTLDALILAAGSATDVDPAELEMLKTLGYIDN